MMNSKINRFNISRFTIAAALVIFVFALTSCNGLFGGKNNGPTEKQKVTVSFSTVNKNDVAGNENSRTAGSNTTTLPSNLSTDFSEVVKIELIADVNDTTAFDFTQIKVTGSGVIDEADSNGKNKITWETSTDADDPETVVTAYQKLKDSTIELFCDTYKFTMNLYIETPYNFAKLVQTGTLSVEVTQETTSITIPTTYCPDQYGDFSFTIYWTDDCGIDTIEAGLFTSESKGQTAYSIPDGKTFEFEILETNVADDGTERKYVTYTAENIPAGNYVFKYKPLAANPSVGSTEYISLIPNNGGYPISVQINGYKTEKVITLNKERMNQLSKGDGGVEFVGGPDIIILPNPHDGFDEDVCFLNKGGFVITSKIVDGKYNTGFYDTDKPNVEGSFDIKLYYGNNLVPSDCYSIGYDAVFELYDNEPTIKTITFAFDDTHKLLAGGYYSLYVTAKIDGSNAVSSTYYTFYVENKEYYAFWLYSYSTPNALKTDIINKLGNMSSDIYLKISSNPTVNTSAGETGDKPAVGYFTAVTEALDACNSWNVHKPYLVDLDMSNTGDRLVELNAQDWIGSSDSGGNGIRSIKLSPYVQTVGSFEQLPDLEELYFYDSGNLKLGNKYWGTDENEGVEYFDESCQVYNAPKLSKLVIEAKDADNNPTTSKYEVIGDKIILRTKEDSENGDYREIFYAIPGLTDEIYGPDLSELDLTDESVWGVGCADPESTACIKAINDLAFMETNLTKILNLGKVDTLGEGSFKCCNLSEIHIDRVPANLPNTTENIFGGTLTDTLYVDMEITSSNYDTFKNFIISNNHNSGMEFKNVVFNENVYLEDLAEEFMDSDHLVPKDLPYDNSLFKLSGQSLKSLTFKKDAHVGNYQFFYFDYLEDVTFEYDEDLDNDSTIGEKAFQYTYLKNLSLNSTESVGVDAFTDCPGLQTVSIGPKLTDIPEESPFCGCNYLKKFTVDSRNNIYKTNAAGSILVRDCSESVTYAELICVSSTLTVVDFSNTDFTTLIGSDSTIESIGIYAFSNCVRDLTTLDLSGIVYIGDYAFSGASSWKVESFTLPDSVVAIGLHAFENTNEECLFNGDSGITFSMASTENWYGCSEDDNISEALKAWAFAENADKPVIGTPGVSGTVTVDTAQGEFELSPEPEYNIENSMAGNTYACYYRDTRTGN